jgi:hypothetical protein
MCVCVPVRISKWACIPLAAYAAGCDTANHTLESAKCVCVYFSMCADVLRTYASLRCSAYVYMHVFVNASILCMFVLVFVYAGT